MGERVTIEQLREARASRLQAEGAFGVPVRHRDPGAGPAEVVPFFRQGRFDLDTTLANLGAVLGGPEAVQNPVSRAHLELEEKLAGARRIGNRKRRLGEMLSAAQQAFTVALEHHGSEDFENTEDLDPEVRALRDRAVQVTINAAGTKAPVYTLGWINFYRTQKSQAAQDPSTE